MQKFVKLSRVEMKNVLGGMEYGGGVLACKDPECGDGVHSCSSDYKCTGHDCLQSDGTHMGYMTSCDAIGA